MSQVNLTSGSTLLKHTLDKQTHYVYNKKKKVLPIVIELIHDRMPEKEATLESNDIIHKECYLRLGYSKYITYLHICLYDSKPP
jgi:hypothetical protein